MVIFIGVLKESVSGYVPSISQEIIIKIFIFCIKKLYF